VTATTWPPHELPLSLLDDLMSQIRCDAMAFFGIDTGGRAFLFEQNVPPDEDADGDDPAFWDNYWNWQCCSYFDRSGDLRSVTKDSDFYSVRQWHSTGLYTDYYRPYGTEHELATAVSSWPGQAAGPGRTVRLVFFRGPGPDFSERDRALLALLALTCTRPTSTPNGVAVAPPRLPRGIGSCCAWSPPGTPTPRSRAASACRRELCAPTCRTSTAGCRYRAAPPQSPTPSQIGQHPNRNRACECPVRAGVLNAEPGDGRASGAALDRSTKAYSATRELHAAQVR
jgi:hypothetical protein